jgi:hypothetical protein
MRFSEISQRFSFFIQSGERVVKGGSVDRITGSVTEEALIILQSFGWQGQKPPMENS